MFHHILLFVRLVVCDSVHDESLLFPGVYKKMRAEEARLSENNHEMEKVKQQHFIQEDKV